MSRTEDQVRDSAKIILGFDDYEKGVKQGTGQITTFNQLGFVGILDKPDGWYLPDNKSEVAIILETKAETIDIDTKKCIDEIRKNCDVVLTQYDEVIGLLHNGNETRAFRNNKPVEIPNELQNKRYYIQMILDKPIDKQLIYKLTARINNTLHFDFGIKNLYHRMIFTACALVAERYNKFALMKGMDYQTFHTSIHSTLSKSLQDSRKQNQKLDILLEVYSEIRMNSTENQKAIDNFISWVKEISKTINSNHWCGEDVMSIFFNEFNRYKKKSESGQVFTPDHITSFMYRLLDCDINDYILDSACGSGAFLVKAMSNMIAQAGGVNTNKAKDIKANRLFGIEFDREIFALACANMLIHKDGKTNLVQLDTRSKEACQWIKSKNINKVLMNPPYENKYGCIEIVKNTLDNVSHGAVCGFILPDKKLEKVSKNKVKSILRKHRLLKIIKLPEDLFLNVGVTTSIFVFETGTPQKGKEIFGCYIEDDGLETVKNQGRQDIRNKWKDIEDYWIDAIYKRKDERFNTDQWINPDEHLSYQMPMKPFHIKRSNFKKVVTNYTMFINNIDVVAFTNKLLEKILFYSQISDDVTTINVKHFKNECLTENNKDRFTSISVEGTGQEITGEIDILKWKQFVIEDLFDIKRPNSRSVQKYELGEVPFVSSGNYDNGVDSYRQPHTDEVLDSGNCISVSPVDGSTFYQPSDFLGRGGGGSSIILLYNDNLNVFNGLFLTAIIKEKMESLFYYGDMGSSSSIKKETIPLPVNMDNQIDWLYMENYIINLIPEVDNNIKLLNMILNDREGNK